jgi:hypothetical protein
MTFKLRSPRLARFFDILSSADEGEKPDDNPATQRGSKLTEKGQKWLEYAVF